MTASLLVSLTLLPASPQGALRDAPLELMPSNVIATFPKNTFLENLIATASGDLLVTSYSDGVIYRVKLDGAYSRFAKVDGKIAGIAERSDGGFLVSGWSSKGTACAFEIAPNGSVAREVPIPGGMFPNGVIPLGEDRYLIADSYAGVIWEYQPRSASFQTWLKDNKLDRANPSSPFPGVNGIRKRGECLYISNTNARTFLRVKVGQGNQPAGPIETVASGVNFDDFALDDAGTVYVTTHVLNSVQKLTPDGKLVTIGGLAQGLAGSTSAVFGRTPATVRKLYVATNGGESAPPQGGIQPAKIIEIDLSKE